MFLKILIHRIIELEVTKLLEVVEFLEPKPEFINIIETKAVKV